MDDDREDCIAGADCSGIINLIFRSCGIEVPRDSHDQFLKSNKIKKGKKVRAVFNKEREGKMTDFFFVPEDEYENWISKPEYEGGI